MVLQLNHQVALRLVVELGPEAKEPAASGRVSAVERGPSNSTEKGWLWRSKVRLLSVFVAFSCGGQNHRSAENL